MVARGGCRAAKRYREQAEGRIVDFTVQQSRITSKGSCHQGNRSMNLVRNPKDKHSLKVRRKLANLNPDYLETLIRQNRTVNLKRFPCSCHTARNLG
jgi:hypothetical protein